MHSYERGRKFRLSNAISNVQFAIRVRRLTCRSRESAANRRIGGIRRFLHYGKYQRDRLEGAVWSSRTSREAAFLLDFLPGPPVQPYRAITCNAQTFDRFQCREVYQLWDSGLVTIDRLMEDEERGGGEESRETTDKTHYPEDFFQSRVQSRDRLHRRDARRAAIAALLRYSRHVKKLGAFEGRVKR